MFAIDPFSRIGAVLMQRLKLGNTDVEDQMKRLDTTGNPDIKQAWLR